MRGMTSGGMPGPSSATVISTSSPRAAAATRIVPPLLARADRLRGVGDEVHEHLIDLAGEPGDAQARDRSASRPARGAGGGAADRACRRRCGRGSARAGAARRRASSCAAPARSPCCGRRRARRRAASPRASAAARAAASPFGAAAIVCSASSSGPSVLMTALTGLLISCAMPATRRPIEASFSERTRSSCARRSFSSASCSSRLRCSSTSVRRRTSRSRSMLSDSVERSLSRSARRISSKANDEPPDLVGLARRAAPAAPARRAPSRPSAPRARAIGRHHVAHDEAAPAPAPAPAPARSRPTIFDRRVAGRQREQQHQPGGEDGDAGEEQDQLGPQRDRRADLGDRQPVARAQLAQQRAQHVAQQQRLVERHRQQHERRSRPAAAPPSRRRSRTARRPTTTTATTAKAQASA